LYRKISTIHMVGIGGAGMSGISEVLSNLGYGVTGSDICESAVTGRLRKLGIKIHIGHRASNVSGAELVVISGAISPANPELKAARRKGIPVIPRIEILAELARLKYTVSVAGTHGKSTTTSMVGLVLEHGGLDPTIVIGGKVRNFGSGVRLGEGAFFVAEADESDGSFLKLSPTIAIVTNIDNDHLDYYGSMKKLRESFIQHLDTVPFYGCGIVCTDNPIVRSISSRLMRRYYSYGFNRDAALAARCVSFSGGITSYDAVFRGKKLGRIRMSIQGRHNILNSLAAVCCGLELGIPFRRIAGALNSFRGVGRRMELKGAARGVIFLDDYGHHPTEIAATLGSLRENYRKNRIVVIFQPHRYSRTKLLRREFGPAFRHADSVFLLDVYPAGEKPVPGVTSKTIFGGIRKHCRETRMVSKQSALKELPEYIRPGDIVLSLGAGDVWKLHEKLLSEWKKQRKKK